MDIRVQKACKSIRTILDFSFLTDESMKILSNIIISNMGQCRKKISFCTESDGKDFEKRTNTLSKTVLTDEKISFSNDEFLVDLTPRYTKIELINNKGNIGELFSKLEKIIQEINTAIQNKREMGLRKLTYQISTNLLS